MQLNCRVPWVPFVESRRPAYHRKDVQRLLSFSKVNAMPSESQRASLAVWDPTGSRGTEKLARKKKQARTTAAVQCVVGLALGLLIYFLLSRIFGVIVCSIALLLAVLAFVAPIAVYEPIKRGIAWLSIMVGLAISFVVLLLLYYLFFVPFGLLFRKGGRNKLGLAFVKEQPSYWVDRTVKSVDRTVKSVDRTAASGAPGGKKDYEQQF